MEKEKSTPQQDYFDANKDKEVVFGTSDGHLFEVKQFAKSHADTLEEGKREVETFKNHLHIDVKVEAHDATELTIEQEKLLESGLVKENYNDLKALVKFLKIETSDHKAETLIKALEDYKISKN